MTWFSKVKSVHHGIIDLQNVSHLCYFWSFHPFADAFVLHTLAAFLFGRLLLSAILKKQTHGDKWCTNLVSSLPCGKCTLKAIREFGMVNFCLTSRNTLWSELDWFGLGWFFRGGISFHFHGANDLCSQHLEPFWHSKPRFSFWKWTHQVISVHTEGASFLAYIHLFSFLCFFSTIFFFVCFSSQVPKWIYWWSLPKLRNGQLLQYVHYLSVCAAIEACSVGAAFLSLHLSSNFFFF